MGILVIIGYLVMAVGGIMLLIAAFQESVLWGIGCLLVPFVALFFVITHWDTAKNGFLIQMAGLAIVVVGILAGGGRDSAMLNRSHERPAAFCRAKSDELRAFGLYRS